MIGTQIGRLRIVGRLGKGGMGEVYVAHDERLDRRVALKAIRAERRLDADARARFLREARVLSQLEHPNICKIFDYVEDDEADFLVLELIEGQVLGDAIRTGIADELAIAEQIAGVLVAAHEKGIVHRDLKPDNVMVVAGSYVKVLDFGLSLNLIDDDVTVELPPRPGEAILQSAEITGVVATREVDDTAEIPAGTEPALTAAGTVLGTIGYMSPEQARGEAATTASDMYSFGLLLQELFTQKPAFEPHQDAARRLSQTEAGETVPIEGIDPDMTALIGRLTSLAPAVRPSAVDTAEKLIWVRAKPRRRRKRLLQVAATVVLALFGVVMTVQTIRATRAETRAREEARRANQEAEASKQISQFLERLFEVSDPGEARGSTVTARELLDKGATRIKQELETQPTVQARLMRTIGNVYRKLGLYSQAEHLLESALKIGQQVLPTDHTDLGTSYNALAVLYVIQGRYDEALPLHEAALTIKERALGPDHLDVAASLNNIAILHQRQGRYSDAENLELRALAIKEKALGPNHPKVATALYHLALLAKSQSRLDEAESLTRRALAIWEETLGPDHPYVATGLDHLAGLHRLNGRLDLAEALFERVLKIRTITLGPDHAHVAACLNNLGMLRQDQGQLDEAEANFRNALGIWLAALGPNHVYVATVLGNLANLLAAQGRYDEAEPLYKRSLGVSEAALGPGHPSVATSLTTLARLHRKQERTDLSTPLYERAVTIRMATENQPELVETLLELAEAYVLENRTDLAIDALRLAAEHGYDGSSIGDFPELANLKWRPAA